MTAPAEGIAVVIPYGGRQRLAQLGAVLANLRRFPVADQIIVSELGEEVVAHELARRWDADYVFTQSRGPFLRDRAINTGTRLARREHILWCDGDVLFEQGFLERARAELLDRGLDYLLPPSAWHYLDEAGTRQVIAGTRRSVDCRPMHVLPRGQTGGMGLVTRDFTRRHGGMIEGFVGWGYEDTAWVHKASLLGRLGTTERDDQPVWHLWHAHAGGGPDFRRNFDRNVAFYNEIKAIADVAGFSRRFPPVAHHAPPWIASCRIVFAVQGADDGPPARLASLWAERIERVHGTAPDLPRVDPAAASDVPAQLAAEAVVCFAETVAGCAALAAGLCDPPSIFVPLETGADAAIPVLPDREHCWILARTAAQVANWGQSESRVWHRAWDEDTPGDDVSGDGALPVVIQPLSLVLGLPRTRTVRIALDRAVLPPAALDRPAFWYVGFHDAEGIEIARRDANREELHRLLTRPDSAIIIERRLRGTRPPTSWTVWPVDRRRQWLDRLSGTVETARPVKRSPRGDPSPA